MLLTTFAKAIAATCMAALPVARASPASVGLDPGKEKDMVPILMCNEDKGRGWCDESLREVHKCYNLPDRVYHNLAWFIVQKDGYNCWVFREPCEDIWYCDLKWPCAVAGPVNASTGLGYAPGEWGWTDNAVSFDCIPKGDLGGVFGLKTVL
ncbi:hypothetical protein VTJ49DRAFT_4028 [Mycothermus thermophilus]|uniref:Uncharacterized protein n=1 Tax=Humicola insolens TaxID=85995 RepID=A0ABR3VMW1_HUMIN